MYVSGKKQLSFALVSYPEEKILSRFSVPNMGIVYALLPGGSKVVYSNDGDFKTVSANFYLYNIDTKVNRQLTFYNEPNGFIDSMDASPNGRWIVFSWGPTMAHSDIYKLELESGKIEKLFGGSRLALSTDGKRLIYIAGGIGDTKFGTSDLVIYDFQTKQFSRLTNSKGMIFKHSPRFSPDGKWVAYIEEGAGPNNRSLVAVKADGSGKKITLIEPGKYILNSLDWGP